MFGKRGEQRVQYGIWNLPWGDREIVQNSKNPHIHVHPRRPKGIQWGREKRRDESFQSWAEEPLGTRTDVLWVKWVNESWVMSQWVNETDLKNSIFGRNNKIKHYFYYVVYLLHCCLHVQGLFLTWNLSLGCLLAVFQALPLLLYACMARRIAFPDTLKNHLKHQIRQSISLDFTSRCSIPELKCCPKVVHISWCKSFKQAS